MEQSAQQKMEMSEAPTDVRLARILLPASILREVDELVLAGRGGYRTRQEFFSDAIQNHVLEVKHGVTEDGQLQLAADLTPAPSDNGSPPASSQAAAASVSARRAPQAAEEPPAPAVEPITDLAATALPAVPRGASIADAVGNVKRVPMIGLHNRDYPSVWSAARLGALTQDGPIPPQKFLDDLTREAWDFAAALLPLEKEMKVKLTALLPTNHAKPQSAEASFRTFAVGEITRRPNDDGTVNVAEALFSWGVAQLTRQDGVLLLGLTDAGWALLEQMEGLTLEPPHGREHAEAFFAHLKRVAPWDWEGFAQLLDVVADRPTRAELVRRFNQWRPDWSETLANTNAAGYVARAREWGLLESKLDNGHYTLTEFGEQTRTEARG